MAKTLLAVDDSVTMRKVLEITFSGEDFRVITAEGSQSALAKLGENPSVILVDTMLGGEDGYNLAKEIRKRSPGAPIVMLASRYAPFDQARGRDAGADDWADKPFDTQQLIDKVRKVILAKEAAGPQVAAPPPPAPVGGAPQGSPYRAPAPPMQAPMSAQPAAAPPASLGRGTQPSLSQNAAQGARTGTLVFGGESPPPPAAAPRPAPIAAPPPAPVAQAAANAVNGHLAGKLGDLGLTPQQAEAVMALSRDLVEKVVWEVVPQMAEALIKEEIARLMK